MLELVIFWVVMATVTAMVAAARGRSGVGFFFYGLLLWPIALTQALLTRRPEEVTAAGAAGAFVPQGLIGARPFRRNDDGSIVVLVDGREVLFPDRHTATKAFGESLAPFQPLPPAEADFDHDPVDNNLAGRQAGHAYPSFVADPTRSVKYVGGHPSRLRYIAEEVRLGDTLEARRDPALDGAVALYHRRFLLGVVPAAHGWVGKALERGDALQVVLRTITRSRRDARKPFLGIEITIKQAG